MHSGWCCSQWMSPSSRVERSVRACVPQRADGAAAPVPPTADCTGSRVGRRPVRVTGPSPQHQRIARRPLSWARTTFAVRRAISGTRGIQPRLNTP
jgi:hypothetical protein